MQSRDLIFITELKEDNKELIKIKEDLEKHLKEIRMITKKIGIINPIGIGTIFGLTSIAIRDIINRAPDEALIPLAMSFLISGIIILNHMWTSDEINKKRIELLSKFVKSDKIKKIKI